jgi:hypothetical protein
LKRQQITTCTPRAEAEAEAEAEEAAMTCNLKEAGEG